LNASKLLLKPTVFEESAIEEVGADSQAIVCQRLFEADVESFVSIAKRFGFPPKILS